MKKIVLTVGLGLPTLFFAQEAKKECDLPADFKEPSKMGRLKKFISIDKNVDEKKIIIVQAQNGYRSGIYSVCVDGKLLKYKKMGTIFMNYDDNPFDVAK